MERAWTICRHNQRVPDTAIRLDSAAIEQELASEGVELAPGALLATARIVLAGDVTRTRAFHEGRIFIQDEASQLVAALVGAGLRLLDCCAAPGGKTAALAARNPTAEIIAAELHAHRADTAPQASACNQRSGDQRRCAGAAIARRIRPRPRRCAVLRNGNAGAQSGDQVASHARRPQRFARAAGRDSARCVASARSRRTCSVLDMFLGTRGERGCCRGSVARQSVVSASRLP